MSDTGNGAYAASVTVPAIVTAGEGVASKTVHGDNKAYLELGGLPLVARVVCLLQAVPEVSEVWVVGNRERLEPLFARPDVKESIRKPLHIVQQFRNLYENAWQTYRRLLPGAGPTGKDPEGEEVDRGVLYLSADLAFATPNEISEFVRRSLALECDYAVGLVPEDSLTEFTQPTANAPGLEFAFFNLREGRFRQSNLHFAKPARIVNRHYIEDMYEHRYQKEFGHIIRLAGTILRDERGGFHVLFLYLLIHLAGIANRHGLRGVSNLLRRFVPIHAVEQAISSLLRTRYRFVFTEAGGCAVDIDRDQEFDVAKLRFDEWSAAQAEKAARLYGANALASGEGE